MIQTVAMCWAALISILCGAWHIVARHFKSQFEGVVVIGEVKSVEGRSLRIRIVCSSTNKCCSNDRHLEYHRASAAAVARIYARRYKLGTVTFASSEQSTTSEFFYTYLSERGIKSRRAERESVCI